MVMQCSTTNPTATIDNNVITIPIVPLAQYISSNAGDSESDDAVAAAPDLGIVSSDAADAGACGNQCAQPVRQAQETVEPGDEHEARGNRSHHHRNAPRAQA